MPQDDPSEVVEPSEAELLELINQVPLIDGFEQISDAYTLPVSINQFWDVFYADESFFYSQLSHPETESSESTQAGSSQQTLSSKASRAPMS